MNAGSWDWLSIRDRLQTISDELATPPNDYQELAEEIHSIARWIAQEDPRLNNIPF